MRYRQWMPAGAVLLALAAAACGASTGTGQTNNSASPAITGKTISGSGKYTTVKTERTSLGRVLATAQGRTVYWFAIDTPTVSRCAGNCLTAWPVVRGMPRPERGVTIPGRLGEIKRSDGIEQATWNGHPLYTYFGDTSPGEANGNMVNGFGGLWYAAVLTNGSPAPSARRSPSPSPRSSAPRSPSPSSRSGY